VEKNNRIWILENDRQVIDLYKIIFDVRFETTYFDKFSQFQAYYEKNKENNVPAMLISTLSLSDGNLIEFFNNHRDIFAEISFYIVADIDDLEIMRFFYKNKAMGYHIKPINSNELIANLEWVLSKNQILKKMELPVEEKPTFIFSELTSKEQQIFDCLLSSKDYICSREAITDKIWRGLMVHEKTFDVHLCNLRSKLSKRGIKIQKLGQGNYLLENIEKFLK